jgi:predicted KAP-like P-loop ATPase
MFRPDLPIKSSTEDLLSRSAFSRALADAILAYVHKESVVTALYGEWGAGKSSVVNLALERIEEVALDMPTDSRPIVVKFNPWNYSDQNQLVEQFFRSLSVALHRTDAGAEAKKAGEQLEVYAEFFTPLALIPDPTGLSNVLAVAANVVFKKMGLALVAWGKLKAKDLDKVRKELDVLLAKQKRKILIVIDDIDRLNNTEIRQIFQLVKALGDFPNTVYMLAFDRDVVVKALAHVQEGSGDDYLEKIIQIPFQIPTSSRSEVEKVLFGQLDELICDIPQTRWDQTRWGNVYHVGLRSFFTSVRDVTRFVNSLRFSFGMVKDEVDTVDFVAITALQVFEPKVYEGIRENPDLFAGVLDRGYGNQGAEKQQAKERCDEIISRAVSLSHKQMLELLTRLFPKLESTYKNMGYGSDFLGEWRRKARVCSPDKFETFFRLAIPTGELSESEISTGLDLAGNQLAFASMLLELNSSGRLIRFLVRMEDYTEEAIPLEHVPTIFNVLMDLGDLFPDGPSGMFEGDTSMKVMRLMHQLSRRYASQIERFELCRSAIEQATKSLYTVVREVGVQGQEHGKYPIDSEPADPEENRTVNPAQLEELEKLAVQKITEWAGNGRLTGQSNLISILYKWKHWAIDGPAKVTAFVNAMTQEEEGLLELLSKFESKVFSSGGSNSVSRVEYRINLKTVEDFIQPKSIEPRLRAIAASGSFNILPAGHQRAVKTFLDTVDGKVEKW